MNIIQFLIEDIHTDFLMIKKILTGKAGPEWARLQEGFNNVNWSEAFKEQWLWLLIVALALVCGTILSGAYYEQKANEYLINAHYIILDRYGADIPLQEIVAYEHDTPLNTYQLGINTSVYLDTPLMSESEQ